MVDFVVFCQDEKGIPSRGENFPKAGRQERIGWIPKTARTFAWLERTPAKATAVGNDSR